MASHVSHAALPFPIRNARFTVGVPFFASTGIPTDPVTPDTEFSLDAGAYADCVEEVTTIAGSNGSGYVTLTGAETNGSLLMVAFKVASGPLADLATLYPRNLPIISSGTLSAGSAGGGTLGTILAYDVTGCFIRTTGGTGGGGTGGANNQARRIVTYNMTTGAFTVGTNWETTPDNTTTYDVLLPEGMTLGSLKALNPTSAGRTLVVDASGLADANVVKLGPTGAGTAQTARDVGASVLLSAGTGAGQLDFIAGVVKANLAQILGTALTETAGQLAAAFKKWFDVAAPVGTVNSIPNATAGAAGGLFIAGSNAATTANITGNVTGNLSGSVGSVTGAVGSVTGAVGSVTGNVGGNVVGSVASVVAAVTIAAASIAAIWDRLTSALTTVGSIGKLLVDNIDAAISSRLASASYTAPDNTSIATILTRTDVATSTRASAAALTTVQADTDDIQTRLPAALVSGRIDASVGSYPGNTAQTGDNFARLGAPAGASIAADLAEIEAETDGIGADTAGVTTLLTRIPGTVQPQTGDSFARLGAPTGVSISADLAEIEAETDGIGVDTAGVTTLLSRIASALTITGGKVDVNDKTGFALTAGEHTAVAVDTQTGLTAQGYTTARAGFLDTLNGLVAAIWANVTRTLTAFSDSSGVTTLLSRLTAGRATNLDNLDAAVSTRLATAGYTAPDNATIAAIAGFVDTEVGAIKTVTDHLDTALELDGVVYRFTTNALEQAPTGGSAPTVVQIRTEIDTNSTQLAAIKAKTNTIPASPAAVGSAMTLTAGERDAVADALLDRDMAAGVDTGSPTKRTPRDAWRFMRNKWLNIAGVLNVYKENDTDVAWTSVLSVNASADPITGSDPAG